MAVSDAKIYLITGQPGNGKTLHSFAVVEDLQKVYKRPVYYYNIPDLALDWTELEDARRWHELAPPGSIIVIDECQKVFPPRKQGAAVPDYIAAFETHRHHGWDVVLTTQHPQLIDINIRKLVGRHFHMVRKFGRESSTCHQWEQAVNPQDRAVMKDALTKTIPFNKKAFDYYRSAEIDVGQKKDFPVKPVAVLAGSVIGIVVFGWLAASKLMAMGDVPMPQIASSSTDLAAVPMPQLEPGWLKGRIIPEAFDEQIPGIPFTAPFYADAVQVSAAPKVSGCSILKIGMRSDCKCTSQQGTVIPMEHRQCVAYFKSGAFDPAGKPRYPSIQPYVPGLAAPSDGGVVSGSIGAPGIAPVVEAAP